jgi:thymidylate synthase (FAD)
MTLAATRVVREPTLTILSRPQFSEPLHRSMRSLGESTAGERLTEYAGRLERASADNPAERTTGEFVASALRQGHASLFHHATFSVLVEGVSLTLGNALDGQAGLRCTSRVHRYVDAADLEFVIPPAVIGDAALEHAWTEGVAASLERYTRLVEDLLARFAWVGDTRQRRKVAREAAASALPASVATALVATASVHGWRGLIAQYGTEDADLERRRLAVHTLRILHHEAPACFGDFAVSHASDRREFVQGGSHNV